MRTGLLGSVSTLAICSEANSGGWSPDVRQAKGRPLLVPPRLEISGYPMAAGA